MNNFLSFPSEILDVTKSLTWCPTDDSCSYRRKAQQFEIAICLFLRIILSSRGFFLISCYLYRAIFVSSTLSFISIFTTYIVHIICNYMLAICFAFNFVCNSSFINPSISIHARYLEVIFLAYHRFQTFFYIILGIIGLKKRGTLFPTRRR